MAHDDGQIYWYDPDPRAVIPLDNRFHVSRSLRRTIRQSKFQVRFDTAFERVMRACAEPTLGREGTWIDENIIAAYTELHQLGFAHCVEIWQDKQLVGGLYGVSICGLYAGESMFSKERDASKVALVYLVEHLRKQQFCLLDTQFLTPHLSRFGAYKIPRSAYKARLAKALTVATKF